MVKPVDPWPTPSLVTPKVEIYDTGFASISDGYYTMVVRVSELQAALPNADPQREIPRLRDELKLSDTLHQISLDNLRGQVVALTEKLRQCETARCFLSLAVEKAKAALS